jgi:hypothetical protein
MAGCATIVAPSGGEKDVSPPKIKAMHPHDRGTGFSAKRIQITFNEFVQLKDVNTSFLSSPPFENQPDILIKGKSLVISLNDTLKPNTTYRLFFGNAVQDLTENNPLSNLTYTFSTGKYLDSLRMKGLVVNAFTTKPKKEILVFLYKSSGDSVVYKEKPYYVAKTNENGSFEFENIAAGLYNIVALKDANNNFLCDGIAEDIGFAPQKITLDTSVMQTDTLTHDTLQKVKMLNIGTLQLFKQADSTQKILKASVTRHGQLTFCFSNPVKNLEILPLKEDSSFLTCIREINPGKDTIVFWLPKIINDSARFCVADNGKILDTLNISLKMQVRTRKGKSEAIEKPNALTVELLLNNGTFYERRIPLSLVFSQPLLQYNWEKCKLVEEKDTLPIQIEFTDAVHRKAHVLHKWKENTQYQLIVPEDAVEDIFHQKNDSILFPFKTRLLSEYGSLLMNIKLKPGTGNLIVQLLNEKDKVIEQHMINGDTPIKFEFLPPGKYQIKAVYDSNKNRKWDTGNYIKKIQPEKVVLYNKLLEIRANWDIVENWDL